MPLPHGKKRKASKISKNVTTITIRKRDAFHQPSKPRSRKRARRFHTDEYVPPTYALAFTSHGANTSYDTFLIPEQIELIKFTRLGQSLVVKNIRDMMNTLRDNYDQLLPVNWKEVYNGKSFTSATSRYGDHEISVYTAGDAVRNQLCSFEDDWVVTGFYDSKTMDHDYDEVYNPETKTFTVTEVRVKGFMPRSTREFLDEALGEGEKTGAFMLEEMVSYVAAQVPRGETWRLYFFACDIVSDDMKVIDMNVVGEKTFKEVLGV